MDADGKNIFVGKVSDIKTNAMQRVAFKMKLKEGFAEEYQKRHDALWPELESLLKQKGIQEYSIFLDEETYSLFAVLKAADAGLLKTLPQHAVMQKWWTYMKDIMDTHEDHSPISKPLKEVFYLP
jgi:L-rhamnose mutarotase